MRDRGTDARSDVAARESKVVDPGKQWRAAQGLPIVPAFDGFRAYAVLGVIVVHLLLISGFLASTDETPARVLAWGTVGQMLDMLFIISGFVIFLPTVARAGQFGSVRGFAIRRSARLLPAYWLTLTLILLTIVFVNLTPPVYFPSVFEIFLNFTFLEVPADMIRHQFFLGFHVDRAIWTLWSEVCFYILLPFIAAWYYRRPLLGLGIAAAITTVWKAAFNNVETISSWFGLHPSESTVANLVNAADIQFPAWVFSIALGMTAASLFIKARDTVPRERLEQRMLPLQILSFASIMVFAVIAGNASLETSPLIAPEYARHSIVVSLGLSASFATFMLTTALGSSRWQRPFANRFCRWVADYSVGMYLFHLVIMAYVGVIFSPSRDGSVGAFLVWAALVFAGTFAYGWASGRFLEQPVRRWAQRFARRESRKPPAPGGPEGAPPLATVADS